MWYITEHKSLLSSLEELEVERDDVLSLLDTSVMKDSLTQDFDKRKIILLRYSEKKRPSFAGIEG